MFFGHASHLRNFPQPPQTFLVTMEEYVRDAPRMVPVREPLVSALVVLLNLLFLRFVYLHVFFVLPIMLFASCSLGTYCVLCIC